MLHGARGVGRPPNCSGHMGVMWSSERRERTSGSGRELPSYRQRTPRTQALATAFSAVCLLPRSRRGRAGDAALRRRTRPPPTAGLWRR
jgi:hypothetical protein